MCCRLDDLLDYDRPRIRTATNITQPASAPRPPASPAPASTPSPAPTPAAESSNLTYADIFQAILEAAQEEKDRQDSEDFRKALLQELNRRRQEQLEAQEMEAARALMQRIRMAQEAEQARQNLETFGQLAPLQAYLNGSLNS